MAHGLQQRPNLKILYGSQTGGAEEVAERIYREARRYHFNCSISAMDEYDRGLLVEEIFVIFVCSTTGQGEEPDNMKKFWRFMLRRGLPNEILGHLNFAVFGLGDSSYTKFNYPAKKLYNRLIQLSACPILERGDGDDQHPSG
ncbi:NADPH-dependent diflavin oxidoreductase 1, partial [Nowakowskiella sp. JEL0078]